MEGRNDEWGIREFDQGGRPIQHNYQDIYTFKEDKQQGTMDKQPVNDLSRLLERSTISANPFFPEDKSWGSPYQMERLELLQHKMLQLGDIDSFHAPAPVGMRTKLEREIRDECDAMGIPRTTKTPFPLDIQVPLPVKERAQMLQRRLEADQWITQNRMDQRIQKRHRSLKRAKIDPAVVIELE